MRNARRNWERLSRQIHGNPEPEIRLKVEGGKLERTKHFQPERLDLIRIQPSLRFVEYVDKKSIKWDLIIVNLVHTKKPYAPCVEKS